MMERDMAETIFDVTIGNVKYYADRELTGEYLHPGDLYLAKRNIGWEVLRCHEVNEEANYVMPSPPGYAYMYDLHECFKVIRVEEIEYDI